MNINNIINILKENGYRITDQRLAILKILISNNDKLFSVEDILNKVKKENINVNMTTIYRNLETLEKLNLLHKLITDNGITMYKLICSDQHHHHFVCKSCGKIEVIDYCPINNYKKIIEEKNYTLVDHKIELFGYCNNCKKR